MKNALHPLLLLLLIVSTASCGTPKPKGWLGITWGDSDEQSLSKLGLRCQQWSAWSGGNGYETCVDYDHPKMVYNAPAQFGLYRRSHAVEGISAQIHGCHEHRSAIRQGLMKEFKIDDQGDQGLYSTWSTGEVVSLEVDESSDFCVVTIAGARFGDAFQSYRLRRGFGGLQRGMRP